jgi:hypothetical protein
MAGDEDDRQIPAAVLESALQLEPTETRHSEV